MNIRIKNSVTGGAVLLLSVLSAGTYAATDSTSFQVKLTVTSTCDIHSVAATDVDFASHVSTDTDMTAQGGLTVNCTNGTPYNIGLDKGGNYASGHRNMKNAATSALVGYELFRDSAMGEAWGNTVGTDTLEGTGTGGNQALPVYGKVITAGANLKAGDYVDDVTATVTY
ncbi:spore coat protein U domain-containing protein [Enterobacter hormaechei]|nr:spore coat protein U domain-containing protein [Enterobacter hormaechei]